MIYGEGIRLRAIERADLPHFVVWLNDPDVREGLLLYLPFSLADEETWFDQMLKRDQPEHPLAIERQVGESWELIGVCGFENIDWRSRSGSVGIFIGPKGYWDQGHGTRTMRLLLKHGFTTLNLNRISLDVFADNPRAMRTYEKVGFIHEGCKRQGVYKNNRYVDIIIMSILRAEWQEGTEN